MSTTPTTGAEPVDLDAIVRRAQQAKSHALNLANLLQLLAPNPPEHDHDDRILAALDAVFPLAARARELETERDRLRAALTTAEVCESDIIHELTQALGLPTDHVASDHCPMPDCDADVSGATHLVWHLARECADSQVQAAEVDRLRGELTGLRTAADDAVAATARADRLEEELARQRQQMLDTRVALPDWLADRDRQVAADALRDAVVAVAIHAQHYGMPAAGQLQALLHRRADKIAAGELEVPTEAAGPTNARVPLADHPATEWLAIHLWQAATDGDGSMELHSRLSGWLRDRQATGLDEVPATPPTGTETDDGR